MLNAKKIISQLAKGAEESKSQYIPLAVLGIINFPLFYFFWASSNQPYEDVLLRAIGFFLCIILAFKDYWPKKIQWLLPVYWYCVLIYTLPFFFTFMLLKNNASTEWQITVMSGLILLMLLVDWLGFFIVTIIGVSLGYIAYVIATHTFTIPAISTGVLLTYGYIFIFGIIFAHNKDKIQIEKLLTMRTLGMDIAHELRTPLNTIFSNATGVKKYFPQLIDSYKKAKAEKLDIAEIDEFHFDALPRALDNITSEVQYSFTFINMLLINASEFQTNKSFQTLSISHSVSEAIARYPFDLGDKEFVVWEEQKDFMFQGDEQLMIHVIFNLLKNAIYYVRAAGKGKIVIWIELGEKYNQLHFKDTGTGISKKILPYIFNRFFSKTYHGTGIGLSFCKLTMKNFSGDIIVRSVEGEYTEFIMYFPTISIG